MNSTDSGVETGNESNDGSVIQKKIDKMQTNHHNEMESRSRECKLFSSENTVTNIEFNISTIPLDVQTSGIFSSPSFPILSEQDKQFFIGSQRPSLVNLVQALTPHPRMSSMVIEFPNYDQVSHDLNPKMKGNIYRRLREKVIQTRREKFLRAVLTNNTDLMDKLLNKQTSPNFTDSSGRTPLHLAANRGYTDAVRLLLAHSANPNVKDHIGVTPLHLAAVTSKTELVNMLLRAGASIFTQDNLGDNPLDLAYRKLRTLQRCTEHADVSLNEIKENMKKVISMLMVYLQEQKPATEQVEALSAICSRLTLSNTSDQIEGDLKSLLENLDSLTLKE